MKLYIYVLFLFLLSNTLFALSSLEGKVIDKKTGEPIKAASIYLEENKKTFTDGNGFFMFRELQEASYKLKVTNLGYENYFAEIEVIQNITNLVIELERKNIMMGQGVTVLGSRSMVERSVTQTSVPVDIISKESISRTGNAELSKSLTELLPSFNAQRQTFSDGTDHITPATLRGLGPDQTLVLINGKRRHTTSHVTVTPVVGKGSVGTDFNAIPSAAIERVEVLRDGASAQYGSDAIAAVVNIILKENADASDISTYVGQHFEEDGKYSQVSANLGYNLGGKGYINVTGEFRDRGYTNRAQPYQGLIYRTANQDGLSFEENFELDRQIISDRGLSVEDFNLRIGDSDQENIAGFFNSAYQINENTEFYAFGGLNHRKSISAGFYRFPNDPRNDTTIYPNGFLPFLQGTINDASMAAGITTKKNNWTIDISNVFGRNSYDYNIENSLNRSLESESPTEFYSGSTIFAQNTTNLNISRNYGDMLNLPSFIVAFGGEMRYENYQIIEGEEASWGSQNSDLEPGAQVFPGFRPQDAVDASRISAATYLNLESDITERLLLSIAGRFEYFEDFGNNINGKFAARYIFDELFTLRAAVNSGFRAPSLHQRYYSSTRTIFAQTQDGLFPFEVLTVNNDSRIANAIGVDNLEAETSLNFSLGATSQIGNNTVITVDAYQIDINDRIVLSGLFTVFDPAIGELLAGIPGVDAFQFFSNAINTRTQGIDVVISHRMSLENHNIGITIAGNYAETKLRGEIETPDALEGEQYEDLIFSREERGRIESAQPLSKVNITLEYNYKPITITLRNVRYGEVTHLLNDPAFDQTFSAQWLTDLNINYQISNRLSIYIGSNNIFDIYPDENSDVMSDNGRFPYNTAVTQFGFNGGFYYAGLNISL